MSESEGGFPPVGRPEFWEWYMPRYRAGVASTWPYRVLRAEIIRQALAIPAPLTVLDAGCGPGCMSEALAESSRVLRLIGIDRSQPAVEAARTALTAVSLRRWFQYTLHQADLDGDWPTCPRSIGTVDVLVCVNVLYALAAPNKFIHQAASVVRPGGRIVLSNPYVPDPNRIQAAHQHWLETGATPEQREADARLIPVREDLLKANLAIAAASQRSEQHFLPPNELVDLLGRHGFRAVYTNEQAYAGTNVTIAAERV